jgi:hypothetical protein
LDNINQDFVVPIALKSISPSRIHIVEYDAITKKDARAMEALTIVGQALFDLVPPVPGIGVKSSKSVLSQEEQEITDAIGEILGPGETAT